MPEISFLIDNLVNAVARTSNIAPSTYGDSLASQVNNHLDRHPEQGEVLARDLVDRLRDAARRVHENRRV